MTSSRLRANLFLVMVATMSANAAVLSAAAQTPATNATSPSGRPIVLRVDLKPGEVLRYELEGSVSFLPQPDVANAAITPARGPCDYALAAVVTLRSQRRDKDGNTPVEATYTNSRVTSVRCPAVSQAEFEKRLTSLQLAPSMFRVGPHGEAGLIESRKKYFDYWNGADLLRKLTLDVLQTKFSSQPVPPDSSWKPQGQFAYSTDRGLHQLELSAANMKFKNVVSISGKSCAWIESKYLFSPLDIPASATTAQGYIVQGAGNNAVAAILDISLLLDLTAKHVAWIHRSQTIDNRLTLASTYADPDPPEDDPEADDSTSDQPDPYVNVPRMTALQTNSIRHPFMSFHFHEDGWARLLPSGPATAWLAALRKFEAAPEPANLAPTPIAEQGSLAQAANPAVLKKSTRVVVDSDTLLSTPAGFTRYEKALCRDTWFCAKVSVALPDTAEIADDTVLRSVYLAKKKDDQLVSVAVGPALDRRHPGLTEDEELRQQSAYYLSNYVWMAVKPGIATSSAPTTIDGYPALMTEFSATQRDLSDIHGVLGVILTPWGKVVPIGCTFDHDSATELQPVCERIIMSVNLRR